MSLTRIGSIGINTGIKFSGLTTITTLNTSIDTLSIGGPVSIAGTLTYEDVTNIDAVGLITARNGIVVGSGITLSKDGDGFFTGVTTATTFVGNVTISANNSTDETVYPVFVDGTGSKALETDTSLTYNPSSNNLTAGTFVGAVSGTTGTFSGDVSIADKIVHTGDTNTAIRFPAADTVSIETGGSEALRVDSSKRLLIGHTSSQQSTSMLQVSRTNNSTIRVANSDATATNYAAVDLAPANSIAGARIAAVAEGTFGSTGAETAYLKFDTRNAGTTSEKVRITSDGKVGINETSPDQALHVKSTGSDTVPLRVQSAGASSRIGFEAGGSPNSYNVGCGAAASPNAGNDFAIFTNDTERVRVDSSGRLLVDTNTAFTTVSYRKFQIGQADGGWINLARTGVPANGNHLGAIQGFIKSSDGNYHDAVAIDFKADGTPSNSSKPSRIEFYTTASSSLTKTERFRITSDGSVGFGLGSSYAPETPADVFANWANTRSNVEVVSSYHRKLPLNERGDITLTARHSPTKDGAVGYVGPVIDFRSTNSSNEEWTVGQIVGGTDPLGGNGYQGGLSIFASNGGNNDPSGRRNQGDAPTLSAVIAPFRITTFSTTGNQSSLAIHITKNLAASNVQSSMIGFDVGGSGRGQIVSASSGSGNPQFGAYSDRRLKTNFRDYTGGYDRIKSIPVKLYDEVLNDQTKSVFGDYIKTDVIGWIADEVQSVFPEAVTGTKDQVATADDVTAGISTAIGDPVYQSLTEGTFLPDAIQAIQKLIEKVETLETKVAALEG